VLSFLRSGREFISILTINTLNFKNPDSGPCQHPSSSWYFLLESIILKPQSYDSSYTDIILGDDELEGFKVLGIFEKILF